MRERSLATKTPSPRHKMPTQAVRPAVAKRAVPATVGTAAPEEPPRRRSPGRVRSDTSRIAILNAALKLLETRSLQQITIEAIAREAEVGKATIYRWWRSKASVVIEAFMQNHIAHTPMPQGVSAREAISGHIQSLVEQYSGWSGRVVAQIIAEGQADPEVLQEFREKFFSGRRLLVREVVMDGRRRGEFRTDMELELQIEVLYAPVYLRLLMGHLPLDRSFGKALASTVLQLMAAEEDGHATPPSVSKKTPRRRAAARALP